MQGHPDMSQDDRHFHKVVSIIQCYVAVRMASHFMGKKLKLLGNGRNSCEINCGVKKFAKNDVGECLQQLSKELIIVSMRNIALYAHWSIFWPQILFLFPPSRLRIPVFFPNFSRARVGVGKNSYQF